MSDASSESTFESRRKAAIERANQLWALIGPKISPADREAARTKAIKPFTTAKLNDVPELRAAISELHSKLNSYSPQEAIREDVTTAIENLYLIAEGTGRRLDIFPVVIRLGHGDPPLTFHNANELRSWAKSEEEGWVAALQALPEIAVLTANAKQRLISVAQEIRQSAERIDSPIPTVSDYVLLSDAMAHYAAGRTFSYEGQLGMFVRGLLLTNPLGALGVIHIQTGMADDPMLKTSALNTGEPEVAGAYIAGHSALVAYEPLQRERDIGVRLGTLSAGLKRAEDSFIGIEQKAKRIDTNVATAISEMEMRGPVAYWGDKANNHYAAAVIFGIAFALLGLIFYKFDHEHIMLLDTSQLLFTPDRDELKLWPLFIGGLVAAVQIWILGTVLRQITEHLRLAEDASERRVMTESLLSLSKHEFLKEQMASSLLPRAFRILFRSASGFNASDLPPPDVKTTIKAIGQTLPSSRKQTE